MQLVFKTMPILQKRYSGKPDPFILDVLYILSEKGLIKYKWDAPYLCYL